MSTGLTTVHMALTRVVKNCFVSVHKMVVSVSFVFLGLCSHVSNFTNTPNQQLARVVRVLPVGKLPDTCPLETLLSSWRIKPTAPRVKPEYYSSLTKG